LTDDGAARMKSATVAIAIVTFAVSALLIATGQVDEAAVRFGFIPARASGLALDGALPVWLTPWSATLVHGNWLHLGLNLVMLLYVGAQVERVLGAGNLLFAYVVGALVAAFAQWLVDPAAMVPMVGASGAISALFGIYALLAARPKPVTRSPRANRAIHVVWLLAAWIAIQWMTDVLSAGQGVMLATPAHIGGFIAGLALERPLLLWRYRRA
jgi:membrane associated rhomboid family serine protease